MHGYVNDVVTNAENNVVSCLTNLKLSGPRLFTLPR